MAKYNKRPLGKCFICGRVVYPPDIKGEDPSVIHHEDWPGDGYACTKHTGVIEAHSKCSQEETAP